MQSIWSESWKSSEFITTKIAFTRRSVAALQENDLANRYPPMPSLTTTLGGTTAAVVADLALHKDGRIDCFEGFDRFFGLAHVLLEWQRGKIEDDGIKPSPGRFYGLRQRIGMIRVKKDWAVAFL